MSKYTIDYNVQERQEEEKSFSEKSEQSLKVSRFQKYAGILTGGAALMSDGYQQGVMTMTNVLLGKVLGNSYTTSYKTMVSDPALVANIIGQVSLGFVCDRWCRKQLSSLLLCSSLLVLLSVLVLMALPQICCYGC
jgi:MFS family permease